MPQKSSVIKCQKCGYVSYIISDTCIKCGSKLEKICGECGFSNAVEKNHCDQCGCLLALRLNPAGAAESGTTGGADLRRPPAAQPTGKSAAFQVEMQSIQDAVSEKDASFRGRCPAGASGDTAAGEPPSTLTPSFPPPCAGGGSKTKVLSDAGATALQRPPSADHPGTAVVASGSGKPGAEPRNLKSVYGAIVAAGLLAGLIFLLYILAAPHIPKLSLKMAAGSYLKRLSTGRYEETYAMLSTNSKSACSLKDYVEYNKRYYSGVPAWEFKDVEVFAMESAAAMIKYQLKEGTGAWRTDYVSFVKEHDRWTRPYVWMLFEPIDAAIAKRDYPQALFLAQKLYLTDPMDPRTAGYLCVAEFFMGLFDKSVDSCKKTVISAETYPVGFSTEALFWYRFYYADSLRFVEKFAPAVEEYGALLASEGLSMKEQCPLFLGRADAFVQLKKYDAALNDMLKADGVCFGDVNRVEFAKRMRFMNGDARAEAVSFAQRTEPRPDLPPFGELRRRELEAVAARLGPKKIKYMPKDSWIAAHLAGPEYRVVLRQEVLNPLTRQKEVEDVYVFMVNLWTGVIKLEQGTLPTGNEVPAWKQQ